MTALVRLELLRCLRSPAFLISIIASPIVTSLILSGELVGKSPNGTSVHSYFLISMAAMGAIYAALMATGPWISKERELGWLRQLRIMPGSPVGYLLAKLAVGALTGLLSIVVILLVGGWVQHAAFGVGTLLRVGAAVWLGTLVFCVIGMALGFLFGDKAINLPILVLNWGFDILGGLLWPTERFPPWVRDVAEVTPTFHIADIAHRAQIGAAPSLVNVAVLAAYAVVGVLLLTRVYRRAAAAV